VNYLVICIDYEMTYPIKLSYRRGFEEALAALHSPKSMDTQDIQMENQQPLWSAQQTQDASERRYQLLYEATPAMLHSIDAQGRLVHVSDVWLKTLGYARDEVVGRLVVDFLTPASLSSSELGNAKVSNTRRCARTGLSSTSWSRP
jgi:PAS domain-containing protein